MLNFINISLSGFSIISSLILLLAYLFFLKGMRKTWTSKLGCFFMLGGLCALQAFHLHYFLSAENVLLERLYCTLLVLLPTSFYFFSREVLFPERKYKILDSFHLLPLIISFYLSVDIIPATSFLIGSIYTVGFARVIFKLGEQRGRFKFEMFFFGLFAIMALLALAMGLSLPIIDQGLFFVVYANSISLALCLVVFALLIFPELLSDILLAAEIAYSNSKLSSVNREQKLLELEKLMVHEQIYQDESLKLSLVAEQLELSSHQLSELINTSYGHGFSKFVRQHRVRAAKSLLINEPEASVLAISMMVGFKSQSNFYTAFKEECGVSPGNYRDNKHL